MDSTVNEGSDKTGVPAPSASRSREIRLRQGPPQCQDMMIPAEPASALSNQARPFPDQLRLAVTACLTRFKGSCREHTESDLLGGTRCYWVLR
jgi:hypothetical protein